MDILRVVLIVLIAIVAVFIAAVVITCIIDSHHRRSGKMKREGAKWEDRKRNWMGLPWTFTVYALDEERLYITRGFLNSTDDEVRLYRITDISLKRSLWQKITGTGTIHCFSGDRAMGNFDIKNIKRPLQVKEQLSEFIEKQREDKHVYTRENMMDGPDDHGGPHD